MRAECAFLLSVRVCVCVRAHTDQTEHFLWQRGETVKDGIALHCLLELHFCHHPSAALITERTTNATPRLKFYQQPLILHRSLSCVFFFLFKFSLHFWQQFLGACNCSTEIQVSIIMLSLFNPATTDFRSCKSVNSFLQALTHICDIFSFTLPWCLHILLGRFLHQMSFYNHAQFQTSDLSRVNSYTSLLNYFI